MSDECVNTKNGKTKQRTVSGNKIKAYMLCEGKDI